MSENTKIEWSVHSWSPWRGCTKVSAGCANCYAETLSKRNPAVLGEWGKGKPRVLAKSWGDPVKWDRREGAKMVNHAEFVANHRPTVFPSLCDWLDEEVPIEWLARFLQLIHDTPNLTWLLLTKRPEQFFPRMEQSAGVLGKLGEDGDRQASDTWGMVFDWIRGTPPANVWVGTSVENQEWADKRIPALLKIPAVGRFLSVEPMLGPVDFRFMNRSQGFPRHIRADGSAVGLPLGIHWVIFGGESGPGARPCNVEWIRDGVRQCRAAGVASFVKQLGKEAIRNLNAHEYHPERAGGKQWPLYLTHPKGGDPAEWPEDLRVREFPEGLR